jgi:hypothetical protein
MTIFSLIVLAGGTNFDDSEILTLECLRTYQSGSQNVLVIPSGRANDFEKQVPHLVNFSVVSIANPTKGALASAALCMGHVSATNPILIVPNNVLVNRNSILEFVENMNILQYSAGCLTIKSNDQKFSYAELGNDGSIVQIVEKQVVGENALAGIYYFRNRKTFLDCAGWSFRNQVTTNAQFYIAPSLNFLLSVGESVGLQILGTDKYFRFENQFDVELMEDWKKSNE